MKTTKQKSGNQPLGRLEVAVMRVLWNAAGPRSIAEVKTEMRGTLAYTTIMTTLDRLHKKGHVSRRRAGKAYLYRALSKRDTIVKSVLRQISAAFFDGDVKALMPHVLGMGEEIGPQELRRLKALAGKSSIKKD